MSLFHDFRTFELFKSSFGQFQYVFCRNLHSLATDFRLHSKPNAKIFEDVGKLAIDKGLDIKYLGEVEGKHKFVAPVGQKKLFVIKLFAKYFEAIFC